MKNKRLELMQVDTLVQVCIFIYIELRLGFLSYTILKIQRNKYITFMLVYTSIALNLFIQLLKFMYKKR
jgi:hypothetical protein